MTLWALESDDDYIAAPSLEAARAALTPGFILRPWCLGEPEHRSEVLNFLFNWEPACLPT